MRRPLTMQARCNPIEPPCLFTDKLRSVSAIDVPTDMLRALSCSSFANAVNRYSPTKGRKMKSQPKAAGKAASKLISERIAELGDWRGDTLARMRALIREADPDVVEEWKWMGTPIWSHDGGICTGESYKSIVKLTFFKGASLKDPAKLFNSSLDGNARRAIDIHEGEEIDANAFKALIRAAVALNTSGGKKSPKRKGVTSHGGTRPRARSRARA